MRFASVLFRTRESLHDGNYEGDPLIVIKNDEKILLIVVVSAIMAFIAVAVINLGG